MTRHPDATPTLDMLGQELHAGDIVVFNPPRYKGLAYLRIVEVKPASVRGKWAYAREDMNWKYVQAHANQCVLIPNPPDEQVSKLRIQAQAWVDSRSPQNPIRQ